MIIEITTGLFLIQAVRMLLQLIERRRDVLYHGMHGPHRTSYRARAAKVRLTASL